LLLPALALRSLTREVQEVAAGDLVVYATGDQAGLPVDVAAIKPDLAVQAFPEAKSDNERNLIELVRLAADLPAGLVAYSAICTHLG
jgi:Rieske Fe-S protein